jgi:predicted CXXCH cytochrome family protein
MHRLSLLAAAATAILVVAPVTAIDLGLHFEPGKLAEDCMPCHQGHGAARTPMLKSAGDQMCLSCHQAGAAEPGRREELGMGSDARPADIRQELVKPVIHRGARCVDCHSVHGIGRLEATRDLGRQRPSTKRGYSTEADLCLVCHGTRAVGTSDPHDIGLLFDSRNPSFHPVLAIGVGEVPSLLPPLTSDSLINCTDCHTNDDIVGARGPHGSRVPGLLGADYSMLDGQPESPTAYALCYGCHDRDTVLDDDPFPLHRLHVVEERTACVVCHNPHGATASRALIRFNEPTAITGVLASASGRLEYDSEGPGTGSCYLTCHGVNHDPLGYGPLFTEDGRPKFADPTRQDPNGGFPAGEMARPRPGTTRDGKQR